MSRKDSVALKSLRDRSFMPEALLDTRDVVGFLAVATPEILLSCAERLLQESAPRPSWNFLLNFLKQEFPNEESFCRNDCLQAIEIIERRLRSSWHARTIDQWAFCAWIARQGVVWQDDDIRWSEAGRELLERYRRPSDDDDSRLGYGEYHVSLAVTQRSVYLLAGYSRHGRASKCLAIAEEIQQVVSSLLATTLFQPAQLKFAQRSETACAVLIGQFVDDQLLKFVRSAGLRFDEGDKGDSEVAFDVIQRFLPVLPTKALTAIVRRSDPQHVDPVTKQTKTGEPSDEQPASEWNAAVITSSVQEIHRKQLETVEQLQGLLDHWAYIPYRNLLGFQWTSILESLSDTLAETNCFLYWQYRPVTILSANNKFEAHFLDDHTIQQFAEFPMLRVEHQRLGVTVPSQAEQNSATAVKQYVARNIKKSREALGWSQRDLWRESGVSQAQISNIENLIKSPELDTLFIISRTLKVSLRALVSANDVTDAESKKIGQNQLLPHLKRRVRELAKKKQLKAEHVLPGIFENKYPSIDTLCLAATKLGIRLADLLP